MSDELSSEINAESHGDHSDAGQNASNDLKESLPRSIDETPTPAASELVTNKDKVGQLWMAASLDEVWPKFMHAKTHFATMQALAEAFMAAAPYKITDRVEDDGWHVFRWEVRSEPPSGLPLIYGDLLYNLRASLDYLVWQLVLVTGNQPSRYTNFPATLKVENWAQNAKRTLAGVDQRWVAEIEALQPFNGADAEDHPLAVLDATNNIVKHRFVVPLEITLGTMTMQRMSTDGRALPDLEEVVSGDAPVEAGSEVYRFRFVKPARYINVVGQGPTINFGFTTGSTHHWDIPALIDWVEAAIRRFRPAFA